jgi:hypothetical protein
MVSSSTFLVRVWNRPKSVFGMAGALPFCKFPDSTSPVRLLQTGIIAPCKVEDGKGGPILLQEIIIFSPTS